MVLPNPQIVIVFDLQESLLLINRNSHKLQLLQLSPFLEYMKKIYQLINFQQPFNNTTRTRRRKRCLKSRTCHGGDEGPIRGRRRWGAAIAGYSLGGLRSMLPRSIFYIFLFLENNINNKVS